MTLTIRFWCKWRQQQGQLNIFGVNNVQQLQQQTVAFKSASTYLVWLNPNLRIQDESCSSSWSGPKITEPSQRWRPTAEQQSVLLEEGERTGGSWGGGVTAALGQHHQAATMVWRQQELHRGTTVESAIVMPHYIQPMKNPQVIRQSCRLSSDWKFPFDGSTKRRMSSQRPYTIPDVDIRQDERWGGHPILICSVLIASLRWNINVIDSEQSARWPYL